jgi:hypothetical protein
MPLIFLIIINFLSFSAQARQEYFTPENKLREVELYRNRLYRGCSNLKQNQDPVPQEEMNRLVSSLLKKVTKNFSRAFKDNPKVKSAFEKDLEALKKDSSCQAIGNNCRADLLGLSLYYYKRFRIDLPECRDYVSVASKEKNDNKRCELELKYRNGSLQVDFGTQNAPLGLNKYAAELVALKNATTMDIFNETIQQNKENLHICTSVQSGVVHRYALNLDDPGDFLVGMDPEYDPKKNTPLECVEQKINLHEEFVQINFDEGRSTAGQDQVEPIRSKVVSYIKNNPSMVITDVIVTSSACKTPFYKVMGGKIVIDPEGDVKNLALAGVRASFAQKVMNEIKESGSVFKSVNFKTKAELGGPTFEPMDLNNRFVTRMTPGYMEKVESLYKKHEKEFKEQALKNSAVDLLDEKNFVNLFQAKFKPFLGFRLKIIGHKKAEMKCLEFTEDDFDAVPKKATKQ